MSTTIWDAVYRRWRSPSPIRSEGYTFVIMTPPDLPCWLDVSLQVLRSQDLEGLHEVLVVPDHPHSRFAELVEQRRSRWDSSPLRLAHFKAKDRLVRKLVRNPSTIHFLQLVNAIETVSSRFLVLHDVDLFPRKDDFYRLMAQQSLARSLVCMGVTRPWTGYDWFGQPGTEKLVATWELLFDVTWARQFSPADLKPRPAWLNHKKVILDTMLHAQMHTPAERIDCLEAVDELVHFGYVVSRYRLFQRHKGTYTDLGCCLLLLRLLVDLYGPDDWPYQLPDYDTLVRGIQDVHQPVIYPFEHIQPDYAPFRAKLETLFQMNFFGTSATEQVRERIKPFDQAFAESEG